tara:strand:- start:430 stop:681 length:252 start_codon:yes stop_codon:yes gene_type:complete
MKNFKVTNLKSKVVQFMNESEKDQFFTKNSLGNYKREDVQTLKRERYNKKLHDFAFSVGVLAVFTILLFMMCGTLGLIDSLIF